MATPRPDQKNLANEIWQVAELLRGDFRRSEYGLVILPFTVLRRFECVLESTRDDVREKAKTFREKGYDLDRMLPAIGGHGFYNTSRYSIGDIGVAEPLANLEDYVANRKNTLIADERERGDVALARWLWHRAQRSLEPQRLVFVDETGTATNMAPRYGWDLSSERVTMSAPHGSWTSTTFVAGLTEGGFIAPLVMHGAMNGSVFEAWVEKCLVPALPPRAIVVMDNLSSHKGARVRELLEEAGAEALYLPPYSPDLNPIEQAFAKLKHLLRAARQRTSEVLREEIGTVLERFEPSECANYLRYACYCRK